MLVRITFVLAVAAFRLIADITPVAVSAALAETTESDPKLNAATATSEMRLKVVFVDIFFLSFSRFTEFP